MTPSINQAKDNNINFQVHHYHHDSAVNSYGDEAAQKLGIDTNRIFKTLVISLNNNSLVVAVIPVSAKLNMKLIAKACADKKAVMAVKEEVERSTGYVLGGVSPLGQKKHLATYIDSSAINFATVFVSAGKRGLELELSPQDLQKLTKATMVELTISEPKLIAQ